MALDNRDLTAGAGKLTRTSGDSHVEEGQLHFLTCTRKGSIKKLFVRAILFISVEIC